MSKRALACILLACAGLVLLSGCTTSRVTPKSGFWDDGNRYIMPGYRPTLIETIGSLASDTDMRGPPGFLRETCGTTDNGNADDAGHWNNGSDLAEVSDLWMITLNSSTGTPTLAPKTSKPDLTGHDGNQGATVTPLTITTTTTVETGKPAAATAPQPSKSASNAVGGAGTNSAGNAQGFAITKCSLKVIRNAVSICILRSSNRNAFDEAQNFSVGGIVAVSGLAAVASQLLHATGKQTALIAAGTAGLAAVSQGLQKDQLPPGQAQISNITTAGLQYLILDETLTGTLPGTEVPLSNNPPQKWYSVLPDGHLDRDSEKAKGQVKLFENSYAHLFDAAMSACNVASQ